MPQIIEIEERKNRTCVNYRASAHGGAVTVCAPPPERPPFSAELSRNLLQSSNSCRSAKRESPEKFPVSIVDLERLILIEFEGMARKTIFVMLGVVAILFLQFADCMAAVTQDQQSMQCCGSMPCDRSNQSHECCKSMVSSQSPGVLPAAYVSVHAPVLFVADVLPSPQVPQFHEVISADLAAPQHSPPELYTLHSSLLI